MAFIYIKSNLSPVDNGKKESRIVTYVTILLSSLRIFLKTPYAIV